MGNQPTSGLISRTSHWTCSPELLERTANGYSLGVQNESPLPDSKENQAQTQPSDVDTVQTVECLLNTDTALRDYATGASYRHVLSTSASEQADTNIPSPGTTDIICLTVTDVLAQSSTSTCHELTCSVLPAPTVEMLGATGVTFQTNEQKNIEGAATFSRDAPLIPTTNCAIHRTTLTATLAAAVASGDQEAIAIAEQAVAEAKQEMQNAGTAWSQDKDLDFETQFLVFRLGLVESELELDTSDADSLQAATDSQMHVGWTPDSDSSSSSSDNEKFECVDDDLSGLPRVYPSGAFGQMMSF